MQEHINRRVVDSSGDYECEVDEPCGFRRTTRSGRSRCPRSICSTTPTRRASNRAPCAERDRRDEAAGACSALGEGSGDDRPHPGQVARSEEAADTRAAVAHMVGVVWACASQEVTVKELRAAVGLARERLEEAYEFLEKNAPLGQAMQRHVIPTTALAGRLDTIHRRMLASLMPEALGVSPADLRRQPLEES